MYLFNWLIWYLVVGVIVSFAILMFVRSRFFQEETRGNYDLRASVELFEIHIKERPLESICRISVLWLPLLVSGILNVINSKNK